MKHDCQLAWALKQQAEKLWQQGLAYNRRGDVEKATAYFEMARESARQCDDLVNLNAANQQPTN